MFNLVLITLTLTSLHANAATIYGNDDRIDLFQVTNPIYLKAAQAAVAMIPNASLTSTVNGKIAFKAKSYGASFDLCRNERFYEQLAVPGCSGFLISEDTVITAGHCTENQNLCKEVSWVFGRELLHATDTASEVAAEDVYQCKSFRSEFDITKNIDYAVIQLNRPVRNRTPVPIRKDQGAKAGDKIVLAGFPRGLPLKLAEGTILKKNQGTYQANIDAFEGNSGGMIFNAQTGEAEGILSLGPSDFTQDRSGCWKTNRLPDTQGSEIITRIQAVPGLL